MTTQTDRATLLRWSLKLDAIASGLCGLVLVLAPEPAAALLGLPAPGVLLTVGAPLLLYAAGLLWNATRATVSGREALLAVILNGAWVAGSFLLIAAGSLTALGNLAVAAVAVAVLGFAVLQAVGLRKLREA
jgi:hypothetical protein